jgi:hypothetical protein
MANRAFVVNLTTAADGSATGYSPFLSGRIAALHYVKDGGANPFANGVDFTITAEATGETLWAENDVNASASRYPRVGTHSTAGVAALYASAGTAVNDLIRLSRDRVKIVIASGGNTKVGSFRIIVED